MRICELSDMMWSFDKCTFRLSFIIVHSLYNLTLPSFRRKFKSTLREMTNRSVPSWGSREQGTRETYPRKKAACNLINHRNDNQH